MDRQRAIGRRTVACRLFTIPLKKFPIKGKLACACSGGIDSLAMTVLAAADYEVVALIIDHNLRAESKSEAARTAAILSRLGIDNVILRNEKRISANVQEKAREIRYKLLTDYCRDNSIKWLATAHHADDNAETFLLRLARGSGVDGLSGIADCVEMNGIKVIRPVLQFTKLELSEFLQAQKIEWVEDPTNLKDDYKRNKLRHSLVKLEDGELITKRINDAARNLARVREFLEIETEKAYDKCITVNCHPRATTRGSRATQPPASQALDPRVKPEDDSVVLRMAEFKKLHDEIAYRVLVRVIMELSQTEKKPRFEKLKRLKDDLLAGKTRTLNGLIFRPKKDVITIAIEK